MKVPKTTRFFRKCVRDTEIVSKWRESPDYEFSDYLLSEKKRKKKHSASERCLFP